MESNYRDGPTGHNKHKINNETNFIKNLCVVHNHIVTRERGQGHTDMRR